MDVNNGSKITRKRHELCDWGIENMFGVVYLSLEKCLMYDLTRLSLAGSPVTFDLRYKCFENCVGKGEIALYEQFLHIPHCFLPIWKTFCHFHQI